MSFLHGNIMNIMRFYAHVESMASLVRLLYVENVIIKQELNQFRIFGADADTNT